MNGWRTCKLKPPHIVSQTNHQIEIRFWRRHGAASCVAGGLNRQIGISDDVSIWNVIPVPILLPVSFYLISVTKLWDMIICLCMCKSRISHANALDFKSHWLTTNEGDIVLPATGKSDNYNYFRDESQEQNISQWCHATHRCSGQSAMRSWMDDDCHGAYDHAFNFISLCTDLEHMVEILKIAYGRSSNSPRMNWITNGEELGLNISKTSGRIYMRLIAGLNCWNVIGQPHLSLR